MKVQEGGGNFTIRSFILYILHLIQSVQNKENEMDEACSKHGRQMYTHLLSENLK
jgi:hypothetical protein